MTLKKFLKYFDDMNELLIYDWTKEDELDITSATPEQVATHCLLFKGYTFDKGAHKKLKKLYKENYVLDRNDDGMAVMLFPYVNEHGAKLCRVQINVRKKETV